MRILPTSKLIGYAETYHKGDIAYSKVTGKDIAIGKLIVVKRYFLIFSICINSTV